MLQVMLDPGLPDGRLACLRPLAGRDEVAIDAPNDLAAVRLLDGLLVQAPGTGIGPGRASELTISDRDRLLIALYRHYYGEPIEGSAACRACGKTFDLAFDLAELIGTFERRERSLATGPDPEGAYTMRDGRRFRLPNAEDQRSILGLETEEAMTKLLQRCVLEGDVAADREQLEAAMAEAGPMLDLELEAECPDCGTHQKVHFDICSHLLGALASERPWLTHEVHAIATTYGWSLDEILGLSREDRRAYARLIEGDQSRRRRGRP